MEDRISELVEYTEKFPEKVEELAYHSAMQALSEIQKTNQIAFNPAEDVGHIDTVLTTSLKRIEELKKINLDAIEVQLLAEDGAEDKIACLERNISTKIDLEVKISKMIKMYSDTVRECLKEKRMLAGQRYGASQEYHMTKTAMQRSVKLLPNASPVGNIQSAFSTELETEPIKKLDAPAPRPLPDIEVEV